MNTNTKLLVAFIGGAVTGALITFALMQERMEKERLEMTEELETLLNEVKEKEKNREEHLNFVPRSSLSQTREDLIEKKAVYTNYAKLYSPEELAEERGLSPGEDDDYHNEYDEMDIIEKPKPGPDTRPYVISYEDFDQDYLHHDKITLTFFGIDGTLADEEDDIVDNIDMVIGYESLDEPGDTIYVRNIGLGADYEVCLMHNYSYQELVLGMDPVDIGKVTPIKKKMIFDDETN